MKLDVGVSADFIGTIWEEELHAYVPTPFFIAASDPKLDWAIVLLDRMFLAPHEIVPPEYTLEPGRDPVPHCIHMINKTVLHELLHLCGCNEKKVDKFLDLCASTLLTDN